MIDPITRLAFRWFRALLNPATARVAYVGVFLSDSAKHQLLREVPPEHPQIWAHHVTLWHVSDGVAMPDFPWGQEVSLRVVGEASKNGVQAVVVQLPPSLRSRGIPHITISTERGVPPAASKALLTTHPVEPHHGLTLKGVVGWVEGRSDLHFEDPEGST